MLYTAESSARTMADLTDDLGAAGLFVYDHFEESEVARHASVLERPELGKLFVDAAMSAVRASKEGGGSGPMWLSSSRSMISARKTWSGQP